MTETEESKDVALSKMLDTLSNRIDELTKTLKEKKGNAEEAVSQNPLAYLAGAFAGGLIVGFLIARGKEGK